MATDALMLTIIVDAYEKHDDGTADVAGAYLNALMTDFVLMKFTGESVGIVCKLNKENEKFVVIENGKRVLYARLDKALYGCVKSALLWYELFSSALIDMGFVLNSYDPCVANCDIDGKQCTIVYTKISHVDPTVVRVKEHVFLGMTIRSNDNGTATFIMKDYRKEAIEESGLDIVREAATPATRELLRWTQRPNHYQEIGPNSFTVSQLNCFVAIRARMDILLAVVF